MVYGLCPRPYVGMRHPEESVIFMRTLSGRRELDHTSDVREEVGWFSAEQLCGLHSLNLTAVGHNILKAPRDVVPNKILHRLFNLFTKKL